MKGDPEEKENKIKQMQVGKNLGAIRRDIHNCKITHPEILSNDLKLHEDTLPSRMPNRWAPYPHRRADDTQGPRV